MPPDLIPPEDVDTRLGWTPGRASRMARKQKLPHYVLPDGDIRFAWVGLCRLGVADLLGISVSSVDRMKNAGQLPAHVKLGGSIRWNRRELLAWVDHGCPARKTWGPLWAAMVRARRTAGGRR